MEEGAGLENRKNAVLEFHSLGRPALKGGRTCHGALRGLSEADSMAGSASANFYTELLWVY